MTTPILIEYINCGIQEESVPVSNDIGDCGADWPPVTGAGVTIDDTAEACGCKASCKRVL